MHPVRLLARAIRTQPNCPQFEAAPVTGICAVTGAPDLCVPRGEALGKSFTDGALLRRPESPLVSVEAFIALKYTWERKSSWFCDGERFLRLTRQEVRAWALETPEMPPLWAAYATTSYKKHGGLKTVVNSGKKRVWLFENLLVDLTDRARVADWWDRLNVALRRGIGRAAMETLDIPPFLIGKIGATAWIEFERWARPKHLSPLYQFLVYLLPSQEELKNEQNAGGKKTGMAVPREDLEAQAESGPGGKDNP